MCIQQDHRPIMVKTIPTKKTDAFSKYSNDTTRIRTLLLKNDDEEFDVQAFATKHYVSTTTQMNLLSKTTPTTVNASSVSDSNDQEVGVPRKTRISFELHPSLIMDDMLEDLWATVGGEGTSAEEVDDEDVDMENDLLSSLLQSFREVSADLLSP